MSMRLKETQTPVCCVDSSLELRRANALSWEGAPHSHEPAVRSVESADKQGCCKSRGAKTEGGRRDTRGRTHKLSRTSAGRRFPEAKTVRSPGVDEQEAQDTVWM